MSALMSAPLSDPLSALGVMKEVKDDSAFVTVALDGRIRSINTAFADMMGYAGSELRDRVLASLLARRFASPLAALRIPLATLRATLATLRIPCDASHLSAAAARAASAALCARPLRGFAGFAICALCRTCALCWFLFLQVGDCAADLEAMLATIGNKGDEKDRQFDARHKTGTTFPVSLHFSADAKARFCRALYARV